MRNKFLAVVLMAVAALALIHGCGAADKPGTLENPRKSSQPALSSPDSAEVESSAPEAPFTQQSFANRRTINYVSSDPLNNALLVSAPQRVSINFSKALGAGSFIDVTREGMKATTGQVVVAPDNRSMYVQVAAGLTGNYAVKYAAYFASGYYEEGSFGFSVKIP